MVCAAFMYIRRRVAQRTKTFLVYLLFTLQVELRYVLGREDTIFKTKFSKVLWNFALICSKHVHSHTQMNLHYWNRNVMFSCLYCLSRILLTWNFFCQGHSEKPFVERSHYYLSIWNCVHLSWAWKYVVCWLRRTDYHKYLHSVTKTTILNKTFSNLQKLKTGTVTRNALAW